MRGFALITVAAVAACSSSSFSKNDIGPDGTLADGGKLAETPDPVPTDSPQPGPAKPASGFESGSRIKTKTITGTDGSKQFVGYYDSERKEDCNFTGTGTGDGKYRCMPSSAYASFFSDSNCTVPIGTASNTPVCAAVPAPPAYISVVNPTNDSCTSAGSRLYRRGNQYAGTVYFKSTGTPCQVYPAAALVNLNLFSLGEEVPLTSFVEASLQID